MTDTATPWKFSKRQVEQYQFNGPHGAWAIITLDPRGIFQAVSDFGTYSYDGWTHHGCASFKHFLLRLTDPDYFLSKVCSDTLGQRGPGRGGQVFDFDRTMKEIRRRICDDRRRLDTTKEEARACWDEADELEDPGFDETYWVERVAEKENLFRLVCGSDYCEVPCCVSLAAVPLRFFNEVFRGQLVPALQAELAAAPATAEAAP